MKTVFNSFYAIVAFAACAWLHAAESPKPQPHSPEFERMKTLVGTWKGRADLGQGPVDLVVEYRLIAAGSVIEERVFAGTPNEMVTMYFDREGKLALTHYCMIGNRPGMILKSSDSETLKFEFDKACGIDPLTETHMNALTIRFDSADTITTTCKSLANGKPMEEHPTTLKRIK